MNLEKTTKKIINRQTTQRTTKSDVSYKTTKERTITITKTSTPLPKKTTQIEQTATETTITNETIDYVKDDSTQSTLIAIIVIILLILFILAACLLKRTFGRNTGFVNQAFEMASF